MPAPNSTTPASRPAIAQVVRRICLAVGLSIGVCLQEYRRCITGRSDVATGRMNRNSSLLEHGSSENRSAAQGGVEAVEGHCGHQQNPARLMPAYQADPCVVSGYCSRRLSKNPRTTKASKPNRISRNTAKTQKISD